MTTPREELKKVLIDLMIYLSNQIDGGNENILQPIMSWHEKHSGKKKWCEHIVWNDNTWTHVFPDGSYITYGIDRWKLCPICSVLRSLDE